MVPIARITPHLRDMNAPPALQKLNLRDINEFLTNELKARSLTTSALEAKVTELNALMEEVKKSHEVGLVGGWHALEYNHKFSGPEGQ